MGQSVLGSESGQDLLASRGVRRSNEIQGWKQRRVWHRHLGRNTGITGGYHSPGYREENEELEEEWSQEHGIWPKFCLLGVARESVVRSGFLNFTPEEGFWTLQLSSAGMSICTSPEPFQILSYCPQQIGAAQDYDGGKVTFTNARLKRSSMNSHLPSLREFSLSCDLTAGGPNLH